MGIVVIVLAGLAILLVVGIGQHAQERQAAWRRSVAEAEAADRREREFEIWRWLTREDYEELGSPAWIEQLVGADNYKRLLRQWYPPVASTRTGTALDAWLTGGTGTGSVSDVP